MCTLCLHEGKIFVSSPMEKLNKSPWHTLSLLSPPIEKLISLTSPMAKKHFYSFVYTFYIQRAYIGLDNLVSSPMGKINNCISRED